MEQSCESVETKYIEGLNSLQMANLVITNLVITNLVIIGTVSRQTSRLK